MFDLGNMQSPLTYEHHMLLKQSLDLANGNNLSYTGPVLIGTPLQGLPTSEFVYDTGSGYLTVTASGCSNCSSIYYNPALSSTAQSSTYVQNSLTYGSA
jgi:hypothetical protein